MRVKVEVVIDAPGNETERILRWMVIHAVDEALRDLTGIGGLMVEYPGIWMTCEGGQRSISAQFVSGEVAKMTVEQAMNRANHIANDWNDDEDAIITLAEEVKRLREEHRIATLYLRKGKDAENCLKADNEVLIASLAQARAERDGLRNSLENRP